MCFCYNVPSLASRTEIRLRGVPRKRVLQRLEEDSPAVHVAPRAPCKKSYKRQPNGKIRTQDPILGPNSLHMCLDDKIAVHRWLQMK